MGEIKSAWEKALERTENIQAQRKSVMDQNIINDGKRLAFKFIEKDRVSLEELEKAVNEHLTKGEKQFINGMVKVLNANLVMPSSRDYSQERTQRIQQALMLCSQDEAPYLQELFEQLMGFFQQYSQNRDMLKENIKEQLLPQIQERQKKVTEKLGVEVEIDVENDPEFKKALAQAQGELDAKYNGVMLQVKEEIESRLLQ